MCVYVHLPILFLFYFHFDKTSCRSSSPSLFFSILNFGSLQVVFHSQAREVGLHALLPNSISLDSFRLSFHLFCFPFIQSIVRHSLPLSFPFFFLFGFRLRLICSFFFSFFFFWPKLDSLKPPQIFP